MPSPTAISTALKQLLWSLQEASGLAGKLGVLRAKAAGIMRREELGPSAEPVAIPMRELGGRELYIRPATTDLLMAVIDYRGGTHLPPAEVAGRQMERIVELGANAGGALSGLAARYPGARLLGAEPASDNVRVARRNVERMGAQAKIVETAIWDSQTELELIDGESFGFMVREAGPGSPKGSPRIPATTIDALLDEHAPGEPVDFMLMTIEGAERRVLAAGGDWVERVQSIRVELHAPLGYGAEECLAQLRGLGFEAYADPLHFGGWAFGVRR